MPEVKWTERKIDTTEYVAAIDPATLKDMLAQIVATRAGVDLSHVSTKAVVTFEHRDDGTLGFRTHAKVTITVDHQLQARRAAD